MYSKKRHHAKIIKAMANTSTARKSSTGKKSPRQPSFSAKSKKRPSGPPTKPRNADVRSREYLTPAEAKELREAAKDIGRHGFRDWLLIMIMYRHGLRVGEAVDLKWDQVDLRTGKLHVNRLKNGDASVHFIEGDELRSLRKLQRDYPDSPFVFASERSGPLSPRTVVTSIIIWHGFDNYLAISSCVCIEMLRYIPKRVYDSAGGASQ